jgi:uncharacterized protein involved in cysteine biosynthesis
MFDAAIKALVQMFSPPFRRVLLKSIGLGLILIVLMGIGLNRVFSWMATTGATWAEATAGGHTVWQILAWVLSIAATLGIITGALFLMPAVTAFVGSFFVDEIADEVERSCSSRGLASSSWSSPMPICSAGSISCWPRCGFARPPRPRQCAAPIAPRFSWPAS